MHLSDAILSPTVSAVTWATSGILLWVSSRFSNYAENPQRFMLMGVLSAFALVAQAMQFTIPGTAMSLHFSGALLLALTLGPWRGFVALASVTVMQYLLLAEGGLMAMGCNLLNGALPACFIVAPLLRGRWMRRDSFISRWGLFAFAGAVTMGISSLLASSEIFVSGKSDLSFYQLLAFTLPIHIGLGLFEGWITAFLFNALSNLKNEMHYDSATATST